ncbi:YjbF family lipoprotein [Tropicibacter oceani]|uniref:YjbF family lipoprotein n=1 Tax=Tropicibacter oceani TaxID=3058420 RepID=A0ABY8QKH5_9RHOB|nr:YjbF family lipoprotein [Tropicibacter oceani]WGW04488.1 YjbF family lipoprotein [Tropicibacter oceani]
MRRLISRAAGATLLALALVGCSSSSETNLLSSGLARLKAGKAEPQDLRKIVTRANVAAEGKPILLIELPDRKAQALATQLGNNGGVETWLSPDGVSVSLNRGIVVATRGLGGDLMTADIAEVLAGLYNGAPRATRIHRYLDGEDTVQVAAFICDYTNRGGEPARTAVGDIPAIRIDESCAGPDLTFENRYWIGQDGRVRKARQWIGPKVGFMVSERLDD